MRRCGICTRCGPTNTGLRQGARTFQVRWTPCVLRCIPAAEGCRLCAVLQAQSF